MPALKNTPLVDTVAGITLVIPRTLSTSANIYGKNFIRLFGKVRSGFYRDFCRSSRKLSNFSYERHTIHRVSGLFLSSGKSTKSRVRQRGPQTFLKDFSISFLRVLYSCSIHAVQHSVYALPHQRLTIQRQKNIPATTPITTMSRPVKAPPFIVSCPASECDPKRAPTKIAANTALRKPTAIEAIILSRFINIFFLPFFVITLLTDRETESVLVVYCS